MPGSRGRVVVDQVVVVGADVRRDRERAVEQRQPGRASDAVVIVAEQDGVGGAARQPFVAGLGSGEERDPSGLAQRQQPRAFDHVRRRRAAR